MFESAPAVRLIALSNHAGERLREVFIRRADAEREAD